ncbi:ATP-binding protein [Pedobacter sp. NJ-S-72]
MVTFTTDKEVKTSKKEILDFDQAVFQDQYTLNLEQELKEVKQKLNSAYEQLDASNENMQSFNEEMISANEEMQSTNEEMQSVNEELDTINSEYQLKNKELLEINDDLNNYFRSNVNGQLFINDDLLLMKFSPGTVKQINLLETDIGRPLSHITTNIKFETLIEDIKNVLSNGDVITKEIETNNGKWYQVMTMPYVRKSDQKNSGAIITFNDITELKKTQVELDISNKMLGMSIDSAELGAFSIHVGTRAFQTSVHFKEIFGFYSEEELSYEAVIERIEKEHRDKFINAIESSLNEGNKCDLEFPLRNFHDNKLHWVRMIGNLSYNNEKKKTGFFTGVLNDITVHKQDEIRKNDFIAMVSHDLKSPLTSIQAYMQLITLQVKKGEDTFINSSLARVNASIKKMNTMINGFLTVSASEEGQIHLELETFEMNSLINEIVGESRFLNSGIKIVFKAGAELILKADRDKIGQVLNNFLNNAIKYSTDEKLVEVSAMEFNGTVQVCVKDNGIGIKVQDQEKLFDRYYRIKRMDTKSIPGFGLGLYLSAEIIKRHHGKVWVESEINRGSSFFFSMPLFTN